MKRRIKITEIRAKIENGIAHDKAVYASLSGDNNPQIVEMLTRLDSEIKTLQVVLEALNGDSVCLNIIGGVR